LPDHPQHATEDEDSPVSQGKTVEGALKNVRKAITAYLKVARPEEVGALPEVLTSQVEVRV